MVLGFLFLLLMCSNSFIVRCQSKERLFQKSDKNYVFCSFCSDNGGFCAMKEVLLVSDDHKSIESVKQLGQVRESNLCMTVY